MATHQPPPPPPVFAMTPPGSQNGRRTSRFTEHPMQEYTPANSVYEEELEYEEDGHGRQLSETRTLLRLCGSAVHLILCTLLLAIMGQFVKDYSGNFSRWVIPQAITLLVLASLDILLDILSLVRCRRRWQSWALLLRLIYAIGYLAFFMVYIGLGRAFPPGYSYWGMPSGYSGPVVYLFLWVIGVWNLLHTALRRHHLGNGMRAYMSALHSLVLARQARDRNQRPAMPRTRRSSRSTARIAQSWSRVRRGAARDPEQGRQASVPSTRSDSISLRERREEEEDKTVSVTSSSSQGKADEAGERPPRALPRARVRP